MGGNLFKDQETRRIESREKYNILVHDIMKTFYLHLQYVKTSIMDIIEIISPVETYESKTSFGDIDFLVSNEYTEAIKNVIKNISDVYVRNGNVISFIFEKVQIDFILTPPENLETAHFFFDYNDLGLLLGKLCYYNRFTLGPEGLRIKVYDDDNETKLFEEVVLSDVRLICNFLGLNYTQWKKGFDTLEDVFEFVMSSKYYDERAFNEENWNSDQRHRDSKRKNLQKFMEYMEFKKNNPTPRPTRKEVFEVFNERFPELNLKEKRDAAIKFNEAKRAAKEKFNGHLVSEKYGIEGKELGMVMKNFYSKFDSEEDRINFINNNTKDNIFKIIDEIVEI